MSYKVSSAVRDAGFGFPPLGLRRKPLERQVRYLVAPLFHHDQHLDLAAGDERIVDGTDEQHSNSIMGAVADSVSNRSHDVVTLPKPEMTPTSLRRRWGRGSLPCPCTLSWVRRVCLQIMLLLDILMRRPLFLLRGTVLLVPCRVPGDPPWHHHGRRCLLPIFMNSAVCLWESSAVLHLNPSSMNKI